MSAIKGSYYPPEIIDTDGNIENEGVYGKNTPFVSDDHMGIINLQGANIDYLKTAVDNLGSNTTAAQNQLQTNIDTNNTNQTNALNNVKTDLTNLINSNKSTQDAKNTAYDSHLSTLDSKTDTNASNITALQTSDDDKFKTATVSNATITLTKGTGETTSLTVNNVANATNASYTTTQAATDNSTNIASTAFVRTAVANLVSSAPATLDTLNELANALGNDPNFATTVSKNIGAIDAKANTNASNITALQASDNAKFKAVSVSNDTLTFTKGDNTTTAVTVNNVANATNASNAATATKLSTAITIQTNLASTSSASFDGTANVAPGVTGILPVANGGTGQSNLDNVSVGRAIALTSQGNKTAIKDGTIEPPGLQLYRVYYNGYPTNYGNLISIGGLGGGELLAGWSYTDYGIEHLYYRNRRDAGALWSDWNTVAFTSDINKYAPTNTGAGASGTWGIDISGTATKATQDGNGANIADTYIKKAGDTVTGTLNVPTQATTDNSTKVANTAFVQSVVSQLVNSAPATLDTLNELANALGNDPNFATTVSTQIGQKADRTDVDSQIQDVNTKLSQTVTTLQNGVVSSVEGQKGEVNLWDVLHRYGENYVPADTSNRGWNSLGVCIIYYTQNVIKNQPTQYGQLINIPASKVRDDESMQIWVSQCDGKMFTRGGNYAISVNDSAFVPVGR